ncbi:MAG: helix-hairpin-helix domain-containing protein [Tannerella sp.]|jgi:hypothetical protein|nr:helix-hairpin-helix domain-containing protein [Tannerella sp.]
MAWRDFLYFSKGERRALILLLSLIALAGIILFLRDAPFGEKSVTAVAPPDSVRTDTVASPQPPPKARPIPYTPRTKQPRESISERAKRLTSTRQPTYKRTEKIEAGTVIELNAADSFTLQKVPGIGPFYARHIVRYRDLLGGFYSVEQLSKVYVIDEDLYAAFAPWFTVDTSLIRRLPVNTLPADSLRRHPHISYGQARAIERLRKQKKRLTGWEDIMLLREFTEQDRQQIEPYLSFE